MVEGLCKVLTPLPGLASCTVTLPRLAPWATVCRPCRGWEGEHEVRPYGLLVGSAHPTSFLQRVLLGENVFIELGQIRMRALIGELDGLIHDGGHFGFHLFDPGIINEILFP